MSLPLTPTPTAELTLEHVMNVFHQASLPDGEQDCPSSLELDELLKQFLEG